MLARVLDAGVAEDLQTFATRGIPQTTESSACVALQQRITCMWNGITGGIEGMN
jgi:hypothetical protein